MAQAAAAGSGQDYLLYSGFINAGPPPPPPPPPLAPSDLATVARTGVRIDLSWTDNATNETRFEVERCSGAGCTDFVKIATRGANAAGYSDAGLTPSTWYSYRVRAGNSGGTSDYSNVSSISTPAALAAPPNLTATGASYSQINLTWADPGAETGLNIERCLGAGCTNFAWIGSVGPNVTSYSDNGLWASTTYSHRVIALTRTRSLLFQHRHGDHAHIPGRAHMGAEDQGRPLPHVQWQRITDAGGVAGCPDFGDGTPGA
jgi:titin